MKAIKLAFLFFVVIFTSSMVHSQGIINLIPKQTPFVGAIDMNKIKTKAGFTELVKLPLFEKMAFNLAEAFFKDTVKEHAASYLDLGKYGINTNEKAYFYFQKDTKVIYGAMLMSLNNETAFSQFIKSVIGDGDSTHYTVLSNYKYADKNGLKIVWNSNSVAFWGASIAPAYKDSVSSSISNNSEASVTDDFPVSLDSTYVESTITDTVTGETWNSGVVTDQIQAVEPTENADPEVIVEPSEVANDSIIIPPIEEDTDEPYTDAYTIASLAYDSIVNEWGNANRQKLLMDKGLNSLAFNKEFTTYVKSKPDVAFVFDCGQISGLYMNSVWKMAYGYMGNSLPYGSILELYNGLVVYAKVDHNKDDVDMKLDIKYSDAMKEIYKEVKKKKISSDFLKYLNKDLMGYYAAGIDIKGISQGCGKFMKKVMLTVPQYGEMVTSVMDVLEIYTDEDRLYNIFTGDLVLSVNGVNPVEVIHTGYKYDSDYNRSEVTDTTTQLRPEVLLMLGVGNSSDVNTIIKLLKVSNLVENNGNYYSVSHNGSTIPVYFKIQDNILFITNSLSYIQNPVVYSPEKQFDKEHIKMFKENTSVLFVNTENITNYFLKDSSNSYHEYFKKSSDLFSNIKIYSKDNDRKSSSTRFVLKLNETEDNSLVDIIKFINSLYLDKEKIMNDITTQSPLEL